LTQKKKKHDCKLTHPLVKVDLDSEFLWNLAEVILILLSNDKNRSKFNNFCSIGSKFSKQQTLCHQELSDDTQNKMRGPRSENWEG
jgi:hypothetical protein